MQHKTFPVLLINSILILGKWVAHVKKLNTHRIFMGHRNTIFLYISNTDLEPIFSFTWCLEEISHKVKNTTANRYRTSACWRWSFSEKERSTPRCMSFLFNESGPFWKGGLIFPVSLLRLVWRFKLEGKPTLKCHDSININILFKCIISGRVIQRPYYVTWLLK